MIGNVIPDIPRLYTALAEWLSCVTLVALLRPKLPKGRQVLCAAVYLLALVAFMELTANVVLWGAFGINHGLAVDTHVTRISFRLGLTKNTDPVKIEQDLMKIFPQSEWGDVNHRLVWFGRDVCDARKPACETCELAELCPRCGVTKK